MQCKMPCDNLDMVEDGMCRQADRSFHEGDTCFDVNFSISDSSGNIMVCNGETLEINQ